jgi:hypothetical protein
MAPWIDIVYIDNEMQKKQYIFNGWPINMNKNR